MNGRFFKIIGIAFLAALCVLAGACGEDSAQPAELDASVPAWDDSGAGQSAAATETPEPESVPVPEASAEPEEVYAGPELSGREPVGDDFFADAAFFGNSLVEGLRYFGGLEQGSFFAATSASVVNVDATLSTCLESGEEATLIGALTERQYGKIYILLGINEIGFEPDYFAELYGAMLERIRLSEPDADIYIMSLTPVTEKMSGESEFFNMERVVLYNEALFNLALEKQCYFVDLCQALAGDDGFLPEEESTDGIHLTREKYPQWAEYLRTHVKQ